MRNDCVEPLLTRFFSRRKASQGRRTPSVITRRELGIKSHPIGQGSISAKRMAESFASGPGYGSVDRREGPILLERGAPFYVVEELRNLAAIRVLSQNTTGPVAQNRPMDCGVFCLQGVIGTDRMARIRRPLRRGVEAREMNLGRTTISRRRSLRLSDFAGPALPT